MDRVNNLLAETEKAYTPAVSKPRSKKQVNKSADLSVSEPDDFLNSINYSKSENIITSSPEKEYNRTSFAVLDY